MSDPSLVFVTVHHKTVGMSYLCTLEVQWAEPKRMKYLNIHFRHLWSKHGKLRCFTHTQILLWFTHFLLCLITLLLKDTCTHVCNNAGVNNKVLILEVLPTCWHTRADGHISTIDSLISAIFPALFKVCKWFGLSCHIKGSGFASEQLYTVTRMHTHAHTAW